MLVVDLNKVRRTRANLTEVGEQSADLVVIRGGEELPKSEQPVFLNDSTDRTIVHRDFNPLILLETLESVTGETFPKHYRGQFINGLFPCLTEIFKLEMAESLIINDDMQLVWKVFRGCAPAAQRMRLAKIIQELAIRQQRSYNSLRQHVMRALEQIYSELA